MFYLIYPVDDCKCASRATICCFKGRFPNAVLKQFTFITSMETIPGYVYTENTSTHLCIFHTVEHSERAWHVLFNACASSTSYFISQWLFAVFSLPAMTAATAAPAVQSEPWWPRPGRAFTARTAAAAHPPSAPSPRTLLAVRSAVTMAMAAAAVSLMTTSTECCGRHTSVVFRQGGGWAQHDHDL